MGESEDDYVIVELEEFKGTRPRSDAFAGEEELNRNLVLKPHIAKEMKARLDKVVVQSFIQNAIYDIYDKEDPLREKLLKLEPCSSDPHSSNSALMTDKKLRKKKQTKI